MNFVIGIGITNHLLTEGLGMPLAVITTSATESERAQVIKLIAEVRVLETRRRDRSCPKELEADKGYDCQDIRNKLRKKGIRPIISTLYIFWLANCQCFLGTTGEVLSKNV